MTALTTTSTSNQVHLTLQGKGGVGKSFVSSLITQYLTDRGNAVQAVDTDPVNATLVGYKAFNATYLKLMEDGSLNERKFDTLMESILGDESNFVIDNGASSFIPLAYYLAENDAINLLTESGKTVYIHTVLTGGQAIKDTLAGLASLIETMPETARIVVWCNEFFGEVVADGKAFEEMQVYTKNKDRIHGIIRIHRQTGKTFGVDIERMLDRKLTFNEVAQLPDFGVMEKSRLSRVKKSIYDQLVTVI